MRPDDRVRCSRVMLFRVGTAIVWVGLVQRHISRSLSSLAAWYFPNKTRDEGMLLRNGHKVPGKATPGIGGSLSLRLPIALVSCLRLGWNVVDWSIHEVGQRAGRVRRHPPSACLSDPCTAQRFCRLPNGKAERRVLQLRGEYERRSRDSS